MGTEVRYPASRHWSYVTADRAVVDDEEVVEEEEGRDDGRGWGDRGT